MKLDNDSMAVHPPTVQMPEDPKHLQHGNDFLDPNKLKVDRKITDEKQDLLLHEVKGSKLAVSNLSDLSSEEGFWPVSGFDSSVSCHDLTNGKGDEIVGTTEGALLGEMESLKGDSDIFTNKNVTELEMAKVVVCCESDSNNHEVRDICTDKGLASNEKILFPIDRDSGHEEILLLDKHVDSSTMRGKSELDSLISNVSEVPKDHWSADPVDKCRPQHLVHSAQNSTVPREESVTGNALSFHTAKETEKSHVEADKDSNAISIEPTLPKNCQVELECNGKGAVSAANSCAASVLTPVGRRESLYNENKEFLHSEDWTKVNQSRMYFGRDQQSHGESSSSVSPSPPSGLISYWGPVAHSGSLSGRSDSSIGTSTRSFAFPVLQSDWNSSPVRMTEADRSLHRKHSRWRKGLLCCKF